MTDEPSRHCKRCGTTKPALEFHRSKSGPGGLTFYCKACNFAYGSEYKAKDPEACRAKQARRSYKHLLRTKFNLTVEQYEALLSGQDGVCAICRRPEIARSKTGALRTLSVDHCHRTGARRGLLCDACNKGIGAFQDDTERLAAAADYLASYRPEPSSQSSGRPTGMS